MAAHDRELTPISVERRERRLHFSGRLLAHGRSYSVGRIGDRGHWGRKWQWGGQSWGLDKSETQSRPGDGLG